MPLDGCLSPESADMFNSASGAFKLGTHLFMAFAKLYFRPALETG